MQVNKKVKGSLIKNIKVYIVHKDGSETQLTNKYKEQYIIGKSPYDLYRNKTK